MSSLVVFSHLRWDFVFQRPQHLLTRFARIGNVLFIEEPVYDPGPPFVEISEPCANVRVFRPHTPIHAAGFHDDQMAVLAGLLSSAIKAASIGNYCAWFYTPMALPLLQILTPRAVIYDCMDELSAFSRAPLLMTQREQALLKVADVVFTGGPSLYEAKRMLHPSVHCFPSAVDAEHFARGSEAATAHPALAALDHPRVGFFGVVDERFDRDLLAALAQARPEWQICIVGPVVKIDPAQLPHSPNIHYFGQQTYADLPYFLAGWDVCLLPFALNEATRYISPTKTLEYMAAERPVVSTAITDVASLYGDLVLIAHSRAEFVDACARALNETPQECAMRRLSMRRRVAGMSWDNTAAAMTKLIEEAVDRRSIAAVCKKASAQAPQLSGTPALNMAGISGSGREIDPVVATFQKEQKQKYAHST